MASREFPIMTGDARTDRALVALARLINEIAKTSMAQERQSSGSKDTAA